MLNYAAFGVLFSFPVYQSLISQKLKRNQQDSDSLEKQLTDNDRFLLEMDREKEFVPYGSPQWKAYGNYAQEIQLQHNFNSRGRYLTNEEARVASGELLREHEALLYYSPFHWLTNYS